MCIIRFILEYIFIVYIFSTINIDIVINSGEARAKRRGAGFYLVCLVMWISF